MTIEFMENPANAEKVEAMSMLSDIHKDAYGYRPRGCYDVEKLTVAEINEEIEFLHKISMENMAQEEAYEMKCVEEFKALVGKTIKLGANDEKTALKWLFDAHLAERNITDVDFMDIEGFVYTYGIMHTEYGSKVINKVKKPYMNYKA